jgi:hypothetical protein
MVPAVVVASAGLAGCHRGSDPVASLVPPGWTVTATGGHIAHPCFGSWEECGTLSKTYRTNASVTQATQAMKRRLASKGWTVEDLGTGSASRVSARNAPDLKNETARVEIEFDENAAVVRYMHA